MKKPSTNLEFLLGDYLGNFIFIYVVPENSNKKIFNGFSPDVKKQLQLFVTACPYASPRRKKKAGI